MSDAARAFTDRRDIEFPKGWDQLYRLLDAFAAAQTAQVRQEVESVLLADEQTIERLTAQVARLRAALAPFASGGQWGTWKAFLVNGASNHDAGIQAAAQISRWQVALEKALVDAGLLHLADEQTVRNLEAQVARLRALVQRMREMLVCLESGVTQAEEEEYLALLADPTVQATHA